MNKMSKKLDRVILNELFKISKTISIFTLYRRVGVDVGTLMRRTVNLSERELISVNDDEICLTKAGKDYVIMNYTYSSSDNIQKTPKKFVRDVYDFDYYIPKLLSSI